MNSGSSSNSSSRIERLIRLSAEQTSLHAPTVRGDRNCGGPEGHRHQHCQTNQSITQGKQQQDRWSCSCGGSGSNEMSRLESRLTSMESRLAHFEALMLKSYRSCVATNSGHPDTSPSEAGGAGAARGICISVCPGEPPTDGPPPANVALSESGPVALSESGPVALSESGPVALPESGPVALSESGPVAVPENPQQTGSPAGQSLIFSNDDSTSTSWENNSPKTLNQLCEDQTQVKHVERLEPEQMQLRRDDKYSASSCTGSFALIRYSTQETFVHQLVQRNPQLDTSVSCAELLPDEAFPSPSTRQQQQMRRASNSLLTAAMSHAEHLAVPSSESGRSCLEPGPPREMAGPPASVGVSRSWEQQPIACCQPLPSAVGIATGAASATVPAALCPRGGNTSCETATASCAVDVVLRSCVTRVRGGVEPGDGGGVSSGGGGSGVDGGGCVTQSPPVSLCFDWERDDADGGADDLVTVSTGEQTTASASRDPPLAAGGHHRSADRARSLSDGSFFQDCRVCCDLVPYAWRRIGDLERDRVRTALVKRTRGGECAAACNVCIQRSGFSKLDTVIIAGLVVKATGLHESEGDQAGFIRLALRRMGFECAVVIGRHFTGYICSLESSRFLVDIGEKSCLIFSLFQPPPSFSLQSNAK